MCDNIQRLMKRNAESEPITTEFHPTMDPQSLEIVTGDKRIGSLLWHNGEAKVEFSTPDPLLILPVSALESIVNRSKLELSRMQEAKAGELRRANQEIMDGLT